MPHQFLQLWRGGQRALAAAFVAMDLLAFSVGAACKAEQTSSGLSISVVGTKQHLAVGENFSLVASLTNKTNSVIYVNEEYLRLKVPKELEGPNAVENSFWYGTLPAADPNSRNKENNYHETLSIKPGDATPVWFFWNEKLVGCTWLNDWKPLEWIGPSAISCARFFLFFVPGSYQVTVTADYWTDPARVGDADPDRSMETTSLDVAAPLTVILIGAGIGGMIAYKILPQPTLRHRSGVKSGSHQRWLKVGAFVGTILLSVIIAILWARLSDAVALIRLTVSDLWGGIAVGFIGNYFGLGVIDKMTNGKAGSK